MSARWLTAFVTFIWVCANGTLIGCQPKIAVEVPSEPITINLNVKIEHEISVRVDKDLEQLFEEDDELF